MKYYRAHDVPFGFVRCEPQDADGWTQPDVIIFDRSGWNGIPYNLIPVRVVESPTLNEIKRQIKKARAEVDRLQRIYDCEKAKRAAKR